MKTIGTAFSLFLLLHSCQLRAELLDGIAQVYDKLADETTAKPPAVCLIDMTHPDTVREGLKKPAGQGHLAYLTKIRTRVPELSGLRCVIVHYTQITVEDLPKTNFKALLIDRLDKGINKDYLEQFYRLVRETRLPAIGFCGGHQLIAQAFGGTIGYMRKLRPGEEDLRPSYQPGQFKEWGWYQVKILKRDPIFDGLGDRITVKEMHAWELKKLPDEFDVLASTDECRIQAIKHKTRPLYGTQFHPENYDDEHPDGKKLLQNFFTIAGFRK
jgi:GMP synthase-like glutamine amidotransferase